MFVHTLAGMAKAAGGDMTHKLAARLTAVEVKLEETQRKLQFMMSCICEHFSIEVDWNRMPTARENKKLLQNPKRGSEKRQSGRAVLFLLIVVHKYKLYLY